MAACQIDHSHDDVVKKLKSQEAFLPAELSGQLYRFLDHDHSQNTLNELFHLFKKYDLISKDEQEDRNKQLASYLREIY